MSHDVLLSHPVVWPESALPLADRLRGAAVSDGHAAGPDAARAWMTAFAATMTDARTDAPIVWAWADAQARAPESRVPLEAVLHLAAEFGCAVDGVVTDATSSGLRRHALRATTAAVDRASLAPALTDADRMHPAHRLAVETFVASWRRAYVERTRDKWREVPATRLERVFSRDLLGWGDEALLAYWEQGRRDTTVPEVRGWFQDVYRDRLRGRRIADVGPGIGIDGFFFASHGAHVTFVDIVDDNLRLLERLARLKGVAAEFVLIEDPFDIRLPHEVDVLLCVGSMHNAPFDISRREMASLTRWLPVGGQALLLAYPKERYDALGCTSFAEFGRRCDGDRTPWIEWYDDDKVRRLFGPDFRLEWSRNFGQDDIEFNWFELTKTEGAR